MTHDVNLYGMTDDQRAALEKEKMLARSKLKTVGGVLRAACAAIELGDFEAASSVVNAAAMISPELRVAAYGDNHDDLRRALATFSDALSKFARILG